MMPPVGKSGPGTMRIRSSTVESGLWMSAIVASMISARLCGGMLVAMPTAMPPEPLTSRFGKRAGRTIGSCSESSKFGLEVDGLLVDVGEQLGRDAGQAAFGVSIRGRRVAVDRAEVALAVDERVAHREVLRHADQRVVDGGVAVRVVLTEHLADDLRALLVRLRRGKAQARPSRKECADAPA